MCYPYQDILMSTATTSPSKNPIGYLLELAQVEVGDGDIIINSQKVMGYTGATVYDVTTPSSSSSSSNNPPNSLFVKHIKIDPLKPTITGYKLARNIQSYKNDLHFLQTVGKTISSLDPSLNFPTLINSYVADDDNEFVTVMASLNTTHESTIPQGTTHHKVIKDIIANLATMHALTESASFSKESLDELWDCGGHISHTLDKIPLLSIGYSTFCNSFGFTEAAKLGDVFQARAMATAERVKTRKLHLVHGDAKLANFMFAKEYQGRASSTFLDFQWTGKGVGASDLVYLIIMCCSDAEIESVEQLKKYYYVTYTAKIVDNSMAYPWTEFVEDFDMSILDLARWIFSYRFSAENPQTPGTFSERAAMNDPNVGSYQKSKILIGWLIGEVVRILEKESALVL
ncbi:hypothetical protein ScalyP_jg11310 [Parmales sp. scaly parma]|nr:hypothetical protein ScalyP_jg11310 [Parmales sp. scaly parma]